MKLQSKFIQITGGVILALTILAAILSAVFTSSSINSRIDETVSTITLRIHSVLEVTDKVMAQRVQNSIRLLKQQGLELGIPRQGDQISVNGTFAPNLYLGEVAQANNFELVDGLTKIMDGTATIFSRAGDDYIRITTNRD